MHRIYSEDVFSVNILPNVKKKKKTTPNFFARMFNNIVSCTKNVGKWL